MANGGIPLVPSSLIAFAFFRVSWDIPAILAISSLDFACEDFCTSKTPPLPPRCLSFASALTHSSNCNANSARWNAVKFLLPNWFRMIHFLALSRLANSFGTFRWYSFKIAKNIIQNLAVSGGSAFSPKIELIDVWGNCKGTVSHLALHFCPP